MFCCVFLLVAHFLPAHAVGSHLAPRWSSFTEKKFEKMGPLVCLFCWRTMCPSQLKSFIYGLMWEFRSSQMSRTLACGCSQINNRTSFFFFSYATILISFGDIFVLSVWLAWGVGRQDPDQESQGLSGTNQHAGGNNQRNKSNIKYLWFTGENSAGVRQFERWMKCLA